MSKDLIARWIRNGVYFGYCPEDILSSVERTSKGVFAPPDTILSGSGYISLIKGIDKEVLIGEISKNRFCHLPFPECPSPDETDSITKLLFQTNTDFREQVIKLLKITGALHHETRAGNLQPSDS